MKRAKRKALPKSKLGGMPEKLAHHRRASVRAKVEYPLHVVKTLSRHRETRYRGLAKKTAQLFTLIAFANLPLAGRRFTITESSWYVTMIKKHEALRRIERKTGLSGSPAGHLARHLAMKAN